MKTFGEWLREQRSLHKLTREEFANRVGCSVAMLRKIEDDERRPSAQIAELIANSLGVSQDQKEIFVKVARGAFPLNRLSQISKENQFVNLSAVQSIPKTNLPVVPSPLIGRQYEVEKLSTLLSDPHCRILTLVGQGGIGKTRLAIETASHLSHFEDGVFFISLAPITESRFIIPIIADSVGFLFQSESSFEPKLQLFNYLKEKQILLLLDNLEQLLGDSGVAEFFAELITKIPKAKLLITSRESLNLQSEFVFEVQGLSIPENMNIEGSSVELFLQRARRANVSYEAAVDDYPAILRICKLVDGFPLGIELAATWVRTLSCNEIANEIERGLDFLSVNTKDLPARHRSMRAVFNHSWKLLSKEEQDVLLRLAVFKGGFSRDAAQQVAVAPLSMLSALVTKSLIRRNETGRYDLHELVRQYVFEELKNQLKVKEEAISRHGTYFMEFLSHQDMRLRSSAQRDALTELIADIDNIRTAQEWALSKEKFTLIEATMRAYATLCDALGWSQEGLDYLTRICDVLESKSLLSTEENIALAHVLTSRSLLALRTSQHEQARFILERSLEILNQIDEPRIKVEAVTFLGIIRIIMGDLVSAHELFKEGLQLARDTRDEWYEALCLTELVGVNMLWRKLENIDEQFQAAVEAWRKTGDLRFTAFGLTSLGIGAMSINKYDKAHVALEESVAINQSIGDRTGLANSYRGLGLVAQAQAQHTEALNWFDKSLQLFTELGARWDIARLLSEMGRSELALGKEFEAEQLWLEALQISIETKGMLTALDVIVEIANLQAKRGHNYYAFELLLVILNHPSSLAESKTQAEKISTEIKQKLTPKEIKAAETFSEDANFETIVKRIFERLKIESD